MIKTTGHIFPSVFSLCVNVTYTVQLLNLLVRHTYAPRARRLRGFLDVHTDPLVAAYPFKQMRRCFAAPKGKKVK